MAVFIDPASLVVFAVAAAAPSQAGQAQGPAAAAAFLTAVEDVPLPEGVSERPDSVAEFDGPNGRIVTVQAVGVVTPAAVTEFYDAALPALGWRRAGALFERGRASLSITFRRDGGTLIVTYRLIERPASLGLD